MTWDIQALFRRHAKAIAGSQFDGADHDRPLTERGQEQAIGIVPTLAAFNPVRVVTSTAKRCRSTVKPLRRALDLPADKTDDLSQQAFEEGEADVRAVVGKRIRKRETAVLCSHGPVLPEIVREIALATGTLVDGRVREAADLPVAGFSVVHLSDRSPASGIIAIETHIPAV